MKKQISSFSILLILATFCFGQDNGYVALSLGVSIPSGDFASTDITKEASGLAKSGGIFDITFAYKLGKNFGLTALLRGQANPVDNQVLVNEYAKLDPTISWTVTSKDWTIGGFLLGAYGSFPIGLSTSSFDLRAMLGYLNASTPEMTVTGTKAGSSQWAMLHKSTAGSFSYLIGAGFKFNVASRICLLANLDYLGSSPEFKNVLTTSSFGANDVRTFTQSFSTVNLTVGIGLRL